MTTMKQRACHPPAAGLAAWRGFTLIEVLVSLVILSVMAATAFKGMDSISRAREVAEGKLKRTLRLQSVMTQFDADMASVIDIPTLSRGSFEFDGARLRFTRQAPSGVQVVVWNLRNGRWERWAGLATTLVGDLDAQWKQSYQLQGNEPGTLVALKGVSQWQVYCWANVVGQSSGWSNCQSTGTVVQSGGPPSGGPSGGPNGGGSPSQPPPAALQLGRVQAPKGIRTVLTLGPGSGFEGVATRDVILAPH
jgi:general secretion pathway protein J